MNPVNVTTRKRTHGVTAELQRELLQGICITDARDGLLLFVGNLKRAREYDGPELRCCICNTKTTVPDIGLTRRPTQVRALLICFKCINPVLLVVLDMCAVQHAR